ncbi:MAG: hypothetical protein R3230_01455 [Nitrosopumilaceae archaeon]|nr:hypothetical protein [Nitrosopumilaceae archaeon]
MPFDKFLIAPLNSGLQGNVLPWLIMDDAFKTLKNAYNWRGRIKRRPGSLVMRGNVSAELRQQYSRLRINVGTTEGNGDFKMATTPGWAVMPGAQWKEGQLFSVGDTYFTAWQAAGATHTTGAATATYDTATGALEITGNGENGTTIVYFYPAEPVMHFALYENIAINDEQTIAFDTQFAYTFATATGWTRLGAATWTGTDADFFSSTNFRGVNAYDYLLFVTNNVVADQIKYWTGATWTSISPVYNNASSNVIRTCRLVASFKDRLLLLNTIEQTAAGDQTFVNRIRFSWIGDPTAGAAFYEDVGNNGGYIEAPTREAIVAYEFVKDRLIIFFEQSTYELVYTGNEVLPFRFQRVDAELGVESQNSVIFFDRSALGFGSTGIHACNGLNVERIDNLIPNEIFTIQNSESGPERVFGIRDYKSEIVYWSYPSSEDSTAFSNKFPNKLLSYNYTNNTWAEFDDSITAFGYYQINTDLTWDNLDVAWQDSEDIWYDSSLQSLFRNVVAGNQEGFVFIMSPNTYSNAQSLQISNIAIAANVITLTIYDHNLTETDYIYINNVQGDQTLTNLNNKIFAVNGVTNDNTLTIVADNIAGTYNGAGTVARVSPITLTTKEFNFYNKIGQNILVQEVQFYLDKTVNGSITFGMEPSSSEFDLINQAELTGALLGSNVLSSVPLADVPFESQQIQLWRNVFPNIEGQNVAITLKEDVPLLLDPTVTFTNFQLHAILFKVSPTYEL